MAQGPNMIVFSDGRHRRPWALGIRQVILDATTEEIALKGFHYARIASIAKRANLTPGSLYRWFESKEVLFRVALEEALNAQLTSNIQNLAKYEESQSKQWLLQIAALVPRNRSDTGPTAAQVLLLEAYYVSWRDKGKDSKYLPRLEEHFATYQKIINDAIASGELQTDLDPQLVAMLFLAVPTGLAILQFSGLPRVPDESWIPVYQALAKMLSP